MKTLSRYLAEEEAQEGVEQAFEDYLAEHYGEPSEIKIRKNCLSEEIVTETVYYDNDEIFTPDWGSMEHDFGSYCNYKASVSLPITIDSKETFLDFTDSMDHVVSDLEDIYSEDESLNADQVSKKVTDFLKNLGFDLSQVDRFEVA